MSSVKSLFGQTAIYGLGAILPRFLNYLLTPLYTYLFTNPADYGINSEIYAYLAFFNVIFTYGMETAYFHFSNKSDNPKKIFNNTLSLIIITTTLLSSLLFLSSYKIIHILHYQNVSFIYWAIGILVTDTLLAIPFTYLRQEQNAIRFSLLKIINVLINISLNLFFFLICKKSYELDEANIFAKLYNPDIGIGYSFLSNLLANMVSLILMFPVWSKFHFHIDIALTKEMLKYALPLLIVGLAGMVNETFDRIILKYLLPFEEAQAAQGIYGACYKISILMTIFIQAYRYAAEPFFFRAFKDNDAKIIYARTTDLFIAFGLTIWLGTFMNLPIIQYFIGPSYRVGLNVVPILLTANLCLGIYFNLSFWYKLTGQTQIGAYITIVGAVITLIINFTFVPRYSYLASAWGTLAAYFSMMLLAYILGKKYYKIYYPVGRILLNCFITFLLFSISYLIKTDSMALKLFVNNILLFLFIIYILWQYKLSLRKII